MISNKSNLGESFPVDSVNVDNEKKESDINKKVGQVYTDSQQKITTDNSIDNISKKNILNKENKSIDDRMIGRVITFLQEIFNSLKNEFTQLKDKYPSLQEYKTFPTFNLWIKKELEENFFVTFGLFETLYFKSLAETNPLKIEAEVKKNKLMKKELYSLEYILLLIYKLKAANLDQINNMIKFSSNSLDFISTMNFIDDSTKNKLLIVFLLVNKLFNHPKVEEILTVLEKTTVKQLISHPSLNIKFSISSNSIQQQLIKNLNFNLNHVDFLKLVFMRFQKNNIAFGTQASINNPKGESIENEHVFTPMIGCRRLSKEIEKIITLVSTPNNNLETYFESLKNLQTIHLNIQFFTMFVDRMDFKDSAFTQIFNTISILKDYVMVFKTFEPSVTPSNIFSLMNEKNYGFYPQILDLYSYNFTLQLIQENKINNLININHYFTEANQIFREILTYISERPFDCQKQYQNFEKIIRFNEGYIQKYENKSLINKLNESKFHFEIYLAVKDIIEAYNFLEMVIKDFILTEIKVQMFLLKNEKDETNFVKIKQELDNLTHMYDLCLKVLNETHKIFNLYEGDALILSEESSFDPIKNQVEEPINEPMIHLNIEEDKKIEEKEDEIKLETKKESINKIIPIHTEKNKNKSNLLPLIDEKDNPNLENKSYYDEYTEYLEESGWKAHMKRRELLQVLKQNGWKINASSGKGSHAKAEGPNGTIVIVPHHDILAKGTSHSIEQSFVLDKLKDSESKVEKKETPLKKGTRTTQKKKKKNVPRRK